MNRASSDTGVFPYLHAGVGGKPHRGLNIGISQSKSLAISGCPDCFELLVITRVRISEKRMYIRVPTFVPSGRGMIWLYCFSCRSLTNTLSSIFSTVRILLHTTTSLVGPTRYVTCISCFLTPAISNTAIALEPSGDSLKVTLERVERQNDGPRVYLTLIDQKAHIEGRLVIVFFGPEVFLVGSAI